MKYGQITNNYHLKKPDREDNVLIDDLNYNTEEIDKILSELNAELNRKANSIDAELKGLPLAPINPIKGDTNTELAPIATIKNIENELTVTEIIKINNINDINSSNSNSNALYIMKNNGVTKYYKWLDSDTGLIEVKYDISTHKFN